MLNGVVPNFDNWVYECVSQSFTQPNKIKIKMLIHSGSEYTLHCLETTLIFRIIFIGGAKTDEVTGNTVPKM